MTNPSSIGTSTSDPTDQYTGSLGATTGSQHLSGSDPMDALSETMQSVRDQAAAAMERFRPQLESAASYARQEPTKAVLIAAAAGAGIMGLVALLGRSGGSRHGADHGRDHYDDNNRRLPTSKKLRKSAADTAEEWRQAARQAAEQASSQTNGAADSVRHAARDAYDGMAERMQHLRDQAGPLVDRVRPQIDAVASYTKDDPMKALLIAAAAGAALMGLMGTTRNR